MNDRRSLDWANQPDPFRRYEGSELLSLPPDLSVSKIDLGTAIGAINSGLSASWDPDPRFLSHLLYFSMAISAWKQIRGTDHRWALRVNPSSGNLHPTETHLLLSGVSGIVDGAYHYYVPSHALEKRYEGSLAEAVWSRLTDSAVPQVLMVLTSIFWRESWKYQQRAYRYCQHDMGHALGAVSLSAALLGWRAEVVAEFSDDEMVELLDLKSADENPLLIIGLRSAEDSKNAQQKSRVLESAGSVPEFTGIPNNLSDTEVPYPIIDEVHEATKISGPDAGAPRDYETPGDAGAARTEDKLVLDNPTLLTANAQEIIRKRRSAVDMDGRQRMSREDLGAILINSTLGFAAEFQRPLKSEAAPEFHLVDLYLYVHRVDGLNPGIYFWDRRASAVVPLVQADERAAAKFVSCFQDIAAGGCLAISMIADLKRAYELFGERGYRYVHYEAGYMGQFLYLTGQALGYDSTGIGCFLDDDVNKLLGLDEGQEVVYNFTIGKGVFDPRLTSLPAYEFPDPTHR
jgi:SagB-type dehydrogenase family enzyme